MKSTRNIFLPLILLSLGFFQAAEAVAGGRPIENMALQSSTGPVMERASEPNRRITAPAMAGPVFAAARARQPITDMREAEDSVKPAVLRTATGKEGGADRANLKKAAVEEGQPPMAIDDAYNTLQGTSLIITAPGVLGNDLYHEGVSVSAVLVTEAGNGALTFNPDGSFTYQPDSGFIGEDRFTYTTKDSRGNSSESPATVILTISEANVDPVAEDDKAETDEDTAVEIDVLANDRDPDDDALTVTTVTPPVNGEATINSDNTVEYVPDANFNGTDNFTYTISDGDGGVATATVTVTVNAVNDAPAAVDDAAATTIGKAVTIPVLANDSDADGDTLTITAVTNPRHGSATIAKGGVTYKPDAGFKGVDRFGYTVTDGNGDTATASVTVKVKVKVKSGAGAARH
ncbi:Ig-like domain-containing protein [Methylobacter sp. BBA5.1]|uniref:Ig-like domain-containing protein n=1 Tax=Methylobacter sp. BBA5.1 TaxID=1495064 RepID=UPI00137816F2|nr:Ig-like domain-containing protein [Methylobacter sp. BBA5.1]